MALTFKIILFLIIILGIMYYMFPLCKVFGNSMYPTFKTGDILISTRLFKLEKGGVYIYKRNDILVIKRLHKIAYDYKGGAYCYFLGDNPEESLDSRDYGYVNAKNIISKKVAIIKK